MKQSLRIKLTVLAILAFMLLTVALFVHRMERPQALASVGEMKANGLYLLETPRRFAAIELLDHHGEPFTRERFEGRWSLVFFGFTHCPDICPTTMAFLDDFVGGLSDSEAADTQVVMVTVDPARDTVAQLAGYVPYFNEAFIGVTGEFLDIHRFATALNTPFRKVVGEGGDYQVDHSSNVILINPRGDYHGFFKAPLERDRMALGYRSARARWQRTH